MKMLRENVGGFASLLHNDAARCDGGWVRMTGRHQLQVIVRYRLLSKCKVWKGAYNRQKQA
ncbi:MAG: hypothetical protein NZM31_02815 [Gemmatales bacterium]|nr:hypothetical protein [Gemmatales bacterium]MDW8385932.1 hypothetical protein [Gemmatales bacterium]